MCEVGIIKTYNQNFQKVSKKVQKRFKKVSKMLKKL